MRPRSRGPGGVPGCPGRCLSGWQAWVPCRKGGRGRVHGVDGGGCAARSSSHASLATLSLLFLIPQVPPALAGGQGPGHSPRRLWFLRKSKNGGGCQPQGSHVSPGQAGCLHPRECRFQLGLQVPCALGRMGITALNQSGRHGPGQVRPECNPQATVTLATGGS